MKPDYIDPGFVILQTLIADYHFEEQRIKISSIRYMSKILQLVVKKLGIHSEFPSSSSPPSSQLKQDYEF